MSLPPMLRRDLVKDSGRAGKKAEKNLAARLGGTLRPGSGALQGAKGDVDLVEFLVESKTTQSASFSVQQSHLHKIYQEALEVSKMPALAFSFVKPTGQSEKRDRWVAVPEHIWKEMMEDRK